jgi:MoaA/NifB/PqqE/SkfB family radical SAM enzyme
MSLTIDFHVTSDCNQECPYCWGPRGFDRPVDTPTALAIVRKIADLGARRVVFTGGDPLLRADIGALIREAKAVGLEVALSTTGDELTREFLLELGSSIDLISLPLDGASEAVSRRTKKKGHFRAILRDLDLLAGFPSIDVKIATPVTRRNLTDVPSIVRLLEARAGRMPNRFFYNVFQAFPRSMDEVSWDELVVTAEEFQALRESVESSPHSFPIHWLSHEALDRLYVMVFPDGTLTVPSGPDYLEYGPFLEVDDLPAALRRTDFDGGKHARHAEGWKPPRAIRVRS